MKYFLLNIFLLYFAETRVLNRYGGTNVHFARPPVPLMGNIVQSNSLRWHINEQSIFRTQQKSSILLSRYFIHVLLRDPSDFHRFFLQNYRNKDLKS